MGIVAGCVMLLILPAVLIDANLSYLVVTVLFVGLAWLLARLNERSDRQAVLGLFALAFTLKFAALVFLHWVAIPAGGPFLGPDSTSYFAGSRLLASTMFVLPEHPIIAFDGTGVAHYYLFAGVILVTGADLFALQLLNCGMLALVAPLTFLLCRAMIPNVALVVGVLTAVHPSLVVLGALDLLKDPSILFSTMLTLWALAEIMRGPGTAALIGFGGLAVVALSYLEMDRFYVAAYIEIGIIVGLLLGWVRRRVGGTRWSAVVALALVILCSEFMISRLGFTPSLILMRPSVEYVLGGGWQPSVGEGLVPRSEASPSGAVDGATPPRPSVVTGSPMSFRLVSGAVELVRRLYGPFVWVMPQRWDWREVLTHDFPLYPGTLVWYAIYPLIFVGLSKTAWRLVSERGSGDALVVVWTFTVLFLAQYLAVLFSYRHRETLAPFLLLFGVLGLPERWTRHWTVGYAVYAALVAIMAIGHLLVKSTLRS